MVASAAREESRTRLRWAAEPRAGSTAGRPAGPEGSRIIRAGEQGSRVAGEQGSRVGRRAVDAGGTGDGCGTGVGTDRRPPVGNGSSAAGFAVLKPSRKDPRKSAGHDEPARPAEGSRLRLSGRPVPEPVDAPSASRRAAASGSAAPSPATPKPASEKSHDRPASNTAAIKGPPDKSPPDKSPPEKTSLSQPSRILPPVGDDGPSDGAEGVDELAGHEHDPNVKLMLEFQQSGNQDAFAQLVARNESKVYSIIYRFVTDRAESEDLTQEVFLRVYRTAARYTPTAKFSTWLYRIAVNVSLNALRSRARTRTVSLALPQDGDNNEFPRAVEDPRSDAPGRGVDDEELRKRIAAAIDLLPENQRIAIVLNKFEELSYDEIAKILNLSMMAVKSLLSRARCNLKEFLDQYLADEEED